MSEFCRAPFRYIRERPEKFSLSTDPNAYLLPVSRRMGYADEMTEPAVSGRIMARIAAGLSAVKISALCRTASLIETDSKQIRADGAVIDSARWAAIIRFMKPPVLVTCFAATIGEELDHLKESAGLFDAYVLECFGAQLTENLGGQLESILAAWFLDRGMACSRRFSPGYCDWALDSGQKAVSWFLKPEAIGLRIMPSGAMTPEKSITSAMIAARTVYYKTPCPMCGQKDCPYRRTGEQVARVI